MLAINKSTAWACRVVLSWLFCMHQCLQDYTQTKSRGQSDSHYQYYLIQNKKSSLLLQSVIFGSVLLNCISSLWSSFFIVFFSFLRFSGIAPSNLGNNTKLVDWMPQNDLLGEDISRTSLVVSVTVYFFYRQSSFIHLLFHLYLVQSRCLFGLVFFVFVFYKTVFLLVWYGMFHLSEVQNQRNIDFFFSFGCQSVWNSKKDLIWNTVPSSESFYKCKKWLTKLFKANIHIKEKCVDDIASRFTLVYSFIFYSIKQQRDLVVA